MFRSGVIAPSRPWLPLLGSLAAHAMLIGGLVQVSNQLAEYAADSIDRRAFRLEYIRIRVPEPVYWAPESTSKRVTARTLAPRRATAPQSPGAAPQQGSGDRGGVLPKGIALPPLEVTDSDTALLQPNSVKPPIPEIKLPSLAFWARRDPLAPKPSSEQITAPGRVEPAGPTPKLASTPSTAVPNLEADAGEMNTSSAPARSRAVTALPSATAPIREQTPKPQAGVFDATAGQSVNIIAVSPRASRPESVVNVPAGSRGARLQNGDQQPAGGSAAATAGAQEKSSRSPERDSRTGERNPWISAGSAMASVGGNSRNPNQRGAAVGTSAPIAKAVAPRDRGGADAFTRIMHPQDGTFDVVVTQSGGPSEVLGAASGLSGSPVYSVYLHVGDEREWVLTFCQAAIQESRNSRYQVYVEAPAPISPPYPVHTAVPNSIIGELRSAPLTFHGFITAAGVFRDMAPVQSGRSSQQLAATFEEWRFRPARKDKLPVEIEVLLILPAAKDRSSPPAISHSATKSEKTRAAATVARERALL